MCWFYLTAATWRLREEQKRGHQPDLPPHEHHLPPIPLLLEFIAEELEQVWLGSQSETKYNKHDAISDPT